MEDTTPAGKPIVDREKTAPFLIRAFVKIGTYHRLNQFEDGPLPIADEQQIYTWRDATLREVLTTLRSSAPNSTEYRHPLARYFFRAVFADSASRGRFSQKDLGTVYSRDILGEPGSLDQPAPRLLEDVEAESNTNAEQDRTLDELRFVPGDYLCVMVQLPKGVTVPTGPSGELSIKGSAGPPPANGWKSAGGGRGDAGWGGNVAANPGPGAGLGLGRGGGGGGGGHWRGSSGPEGPPPRGGRGGGRGDFGRDRDRDRDDRRVPPPRRDSPPRRDGGWGRRGASRSRSPPRRRGRYD